MATKLDLVFNAFTAQAQTAVKGLLDTVNVGLAAVLAGNKQAAGAARQFGDSTAAGMSRADKAIDQVNDRLATMTDFIKQGIGIDIGGKIVGALQRIPDLLKESTKRGVEFNQTMEDARFAIAATLLQFNGDQYGNSVDKALVAADQALARLTEKAKKSPATLKELIGSFNAVSAAASAAGIPIQRQVDLVVQMSQALAGMGIRSEQIIQETRALLTGNITEDAMAARMLNITAAQIAAAKANGELDTFIESRISAYVKVGERAANSFTQLASNLADSIDQAFGRATQQIFATLKDKILELYKIVDDPKFVQNLGVIADDLEDLLSVTLDLATVAIENASKLWIAMKTLIGTLVLFKAISWVGKLAVDLAAVASTAPAIAGLTKALVGLGWALGWTLAGFLGWQAGNFLGELDTGWAGLNLKVKEWAQLTSVEVMKMGVEIKAALGLINEREAFERLQVLAATFKELQGANGSLAGGKGESETDKKEGGRSLTQDQIDAARELALQKKQVALDVKKAELDRERELVEQSFADQQIKLEGYLARRIQLTVQANAAELALLAAQEQQIKFQMLTESDPAKKAKLTGELVEIDGQKKQLAIKLEKDLDAITRDGEQRRKEIREKAAQDQRELLNKISDDYREATFTKRELLEYEYNQQKALILRSIKDEEERNIALLQLRAVYLAKKAVLDAQDEVKAKERSLKAERDEIATERARIQNSFLLTNVQKRKQEIDLLEREEKATRAIVEQLQEKARLAREAGNEAAAAAYEGQVGQLEDQARGLSTQRAGMEAQADPESIRQQMRSVMTEFQDSVGTLAQQLAGLFRDVIGGAVDGVAQGIEGLLRGTMSWGQALSHIGTTVLNAIIGGFARMAAQWVIAQLIMLFASKAGQAASVAAAAPAAAAATALWTVPATLATIATMGGSALAAPAQITASAGATAGLMAGFQGAASAGAIAGGGFKDGGYTGDGSPNEVAGVVHKGEYVFTAAKVKAMGRGFFEKLGAGFNAVSQLDIRRPAWASQGGGGPMAGVQPLGGRSSTVQQEPPVVNVHVGVVDSSKQKIAEFLLSNPGQKILFDSVSGRKLDLGIQS